MSEPRRKVSKEVPKPIEPELEVQEETNVKFSSDEVPKFDSYGKIPNLTEVVKVRVKIGTLRWEGGTYEKGTVFEAVRERALKMGSSVEILE